MIDTSKKPTAADIAFKTKLLRNLSKIAAEYALNANLDNENELDRIIDSVILISELSEELYIITQVHSECADYADFIASLKAAPEQPEKAGDSE